MQGYAARKGNRWYAVIYQRLDPVTGREQRSWHAAGRRRARRSVLVRAVPARPSHAARSRRLPRRLAEPAPPRYPRLGHRLLARSASRRLPERSRRMADPHGRTLSANRSRRSVTLDEALGIVARLAMTADLNLREAAAVRTVCRHLTSEQRDAPADRPTQSAAPV